VLSVLIKKYGSKGTHLEQQKAALDKIKSKRRNQPATPASATPAQ
jgi:hypothetical protein